MLRLLTSRTFRCASYRMAAELPLKPPAAFRSLLHTSGPGCFPDGRSEPLVPCIARAHGPRVCSSIDSVEIVGNTAVRHTMRSDCVMATRIHSAVV
jgi:hypothetical protein